MNNTTNTAGEALDLNKSRAEFEAHFKSEGWSDMHFARYHTYPMQDAGYKSRHVADMWDGWSAALARAGLATGQQAEPVASNLTTVPCPCCGEGSIVVCDECDGQGRLIVDRRDLAPVSAAPAAPPDWHDTIQRAANIAHGYGHPELHSKLAAILAAPAAAQDEWISVEDRLPEHECLAVYVTPNGKQRLIRAKYARQFQIEAEGDDCETEYNEENDTFYIKAGWLECIDNWGEYSSCYVVEGVVTHWKPSPALPVAAQPKDTTDTTKEKA